MFNRKKYMKEYYKKRYLIKKIEILAKSKKYRELHKEELKERDRKYYLTHKKQHKQNYKKYYKEHRQELLQYQKNYRANNPEKIKVTQKKYNDRNREINNKKRQEKLKNNIQFKLSCYLRSKLRKLIKKEHKYNSALKLLGCSLKELKHHLESKFKLGMSWSNYGLYGWHIDHIIPCAKFDLSKKSEQHKCFHYTNLQPLWAKENLKKSDKYE